jgi:hypothetical protein
MLRAVLAVVLAVASGGCVGRDAARSGRIAMEVGETQVLDAFDSLAVWRSQPAEGVALDISTAEGYRGSAMRLDFDFQGGGGYAVARRELQLVVPENYQFTFWIRADAPINNLEFKLIDPSGENVWWVNQREYAFPREWTRVTLKKRHISFAWGPRGGGELDSIAAIELAITAGTGGKGTVWIDELALTRLEPARPYTGTPVAESRAEGMDARPSHVLDGDSATAWRAANAEAWLELDFGRGREFGGLVLEWEPGAHPPDYAVLGSLDGSAWDTLRVVRGSDGGRDYLYLPESEAQRVRVQPQGTASGPFALRELEVKPLEWAPSRNGFFAAIARDAPRGWYPRDMLGEATYWTIVGVDRDSVEALIDIDGRVEPGKRSFSIEPFVFDRGVLTSWTNVERSPSLQEGVLPIPSVRWLSDSLALTVTAFAAGVPGSSALHMRYRVVNRGAGRANPTLYLALRPFQVNPSYQFLNNPGGTALVDSIAFDGAMITVNGFRSVIPRTPPSGFGAAAFDGGGIVPRIAQGMLPSADTVRDPFGHASAALAYELDLAAGGDAEVYLTIPLQRYTGPAPALMAAADYEALLERTAAVWRERLGRVGISLPAGARHITNTLRSTVAYVLLNRDGSAIQPGSRSYERSWIRDGSLTSAALLRMGHEDAVRQFIEWYAPYQYPSGRVPCCVDASGAGAVPEHDSHGQLIYLIAEYWRYTRDRAFLERMWPHVAGSVAAIESLRAERTTDEYRSPDRRHFYGILPPSISHEGYSAKPMHSYWDDFFALKGLKDAALIAEVLGRPEAARFMSLRDEFRGDLLASIQAAMELHNIDFIPGAADLGDFDPTSTTVAIAPGGELASLPADALARTFERYWEESVARADGRRDWENYTPYELRTVGTFVRRGQKQRAHDLLDFFFRHQRPPQWNHWAEVVWRDAGTPKFIGDMPHTWVGSDYIRSVLDMFAYEREADDALVIGAGLLESWVTSAEGAGVTNLRTPFGRLTFNMRGNAQEVRTTIGAVERMPGGGVVIVSPFDAPVREALVNGTPAAVEAGKEVRLRALPATVVLRY